MIRKLISVIFVLTFLATTAHAQSKLIYYLNPFSNSNGSPGDQGYAVMDPDTGVEAASGAFADVAGKAVTGGIAITKHPVTGELWGLLKLSGQSGRELVKIDASTFAVTDIGNTGDNFSTLAFNSDGSVLYAVTGNGASNPETLYTLNQTTGAATLQCALGNGADGEVIAYNPNDDKLYHWSGNGTVVYERIDDLSGPSCTVTNIGMSGYTGGEIFGAVFDPSIQKFYISNISSNLLTVNVDGTSPTVVRPTTFAGGNGDARGLGLIFQVEMDVIGNETSIVSGDMMPSTDDDTDFGTISYVSTITKTFTIENEASSALNLTGDPLVQLTGDPEFSVTALPTTPITGQGSTTTFQITFDPTAAGTKAAVVSIANNDSNENPYTFSIQATAASDNDMDGIIDADDTDDDNDGVSDAQEDADGTDPFDPDSFIEHLGSTVCTEWNGFLSFMSQVLEQRNITSSPVSYTTTLYNSSGVAQSSVNFTLQPSQQLDLIVNDMQGFVSSAYGTICTTALTVGTSLPQDYLSGNYVYYLLGDQFTGSVAFANPFFELAFSEALIAGKTGNQYLTSNTYNPSLNSADSGDFIGSFIQISNDENTTQTGQLIYRGFNGEVLRVTNVSLAAKQRKDIDIHSLGTNITGLIEWVPSSAEAVFRVRQNRYYFDGDFATGSIKSGTSIPAKRGSGNLLTAAFSTVNRYAVLEISNTTSSATQVDVDIFTSSGATTPSLLPLLSVPAKGTRHVILDEYLDEAIGNVRVDANVTSGVIVALMEYGLGDGNSITFANNLLVRQSFGETLSNTYNNFLGSCTLRISNSSSDTVNTIVQMRRYDQTVVVAGMELTIPGNGAKSIDICSLDQESSYGVVTVGVLGFDTTLGAPTSVIVSDVVRKSANTDAEFATPATPNGEIDFCPVGAEGSIGLAC